MNPYYAKTLDFQEKLKKYASNIFCTYGRELVLNLAEYNLLHRENVDMENSNVINMALEEFLASKLEIYTHCVGSEYVIDRSVRAVKEIQYDCYTIRDGVKYMFNVKAEAVQNSADDSVSSAKRKDENAFELRVKYSLRDSYKEPKSGVYHPRHIYIEQVDVEELSLN